MKKPSKEAIIKAWVKTSYCYCRALKEHYPELLKDFTDEQMKSYGCDQDMRRILKESKVEERSTDIHRLYMKYVLQLSTKDLEQMISYDKEGFIRRAPHTIEEIQLELFHRAVENSETKETT